VVWGGRMERSLVGGFGGVIDCPTNLLSRQENEKNPEREILENGENSDPAKRKESEREKKCREQNRSSKSLVKRHITRWLFKNGN